MAGDVCFHNAVVYNGYSMMKNCAVLIRNDKIVDVFNEERFFQKKFDDSTRLIDVKGCSIAPGFIDTHIHGFCGYGTTHFASSESLFAPPVIFKR